ncbi:AI-2E family transporter [Puniceibacterium sp. IMCC21224]|uniref:AI-2E family transporter n=1 Tax=Puniceibacterium sp. IMCC21224 TaxID=1618204 RepID=UPI00065CFDD4|nr:AI-2E family transporter [Puniceibacterium sp. IMCC21224]KMK66112.1 putative permease [Puniceibacterium sp. IMCC21224]
MNNTSSNRPHVSVRLSLIVLAVLASLFALHAAQNIAAPMVLGIVTAVILAPLMDFFGRLHIPAGWAATLILILTLSILGLLIIALEPLFWRVADELPRIRSELQSIVIDLRSMIRGLDDMSEEMQKVIGGDAAAKSGNTEDQAATQLPTVADALFLAPVLMAKALVFAGTFYFFLLTRLEIYLALARRLGGAAQASQVQQRFRTAEKLVSRYFITISAINLGLGLLLAAVLALIGLPAPLVWGMAAALLNYVLYVGPGLIASGLVLAGIVHFDGLMVVAPVACFLTINMLEAQFVTPSMIGRHVSLNALLVFGALVFGLWFWGPIGGIVSIPVLVIAVALLDESGVRGASLTAPA